MKVSDIVPIDDYVLLAPNKGEEKSPGGIVLPSRMQCAKTHRVLAVGNGLVRPGGSKDSIERIPIPLSPGDDVILPNPVEISAGSNGTIEVEDEEASSMIPNTTKKVYMVRASQIAAIVTSVD